MGWIFFIFLAIFIAIIGGLIMASDKKDDTLDIIGLIITCIALGLMFYAGYGLGEHHGAKTQMQGGYKVEYVTDTNGIVNDTIIHTQGY